MTTSHFVLIASYQYQENYGDAERPHWRFKGEHEEVICSMSLDMINDMVANGESVDKTLKSIIEQSELGFYHHTEFTIYSAMDYQLFELNEGTIRIPLGSASIG